jgi:hypothetical protein
MDAVEMPGRLADNLLVFYPAEQRPPAHAATANLRTSATTK